MVKVYFIHFLFSFDELLELSQRGDNRTIDMLVGDIYGGMDYSKVYYWFVHFFQYSSK
jgi:pantothenate kinase